MQTQACHAPWRNLFFSANGTVFTCCSNRTYAMGYYPQQSIAEIWQGERMNDLRQALAQNNFSKGCYGCQLLWEEKNYEAMPAKVYGQANEEEHTLCRCWCCHQQ